MEAGMDHPDQSLPPISLRWWTIAWGLLGALFVARVVFDGLLTFPSDWDTLAYHVPLVDHWLRDGTLYVPNCAFWYCPGNNEVLALWMVAPFSGDYLIALNNLPAVILLALAGVQLVASFGVPQTLCHLAGMAIMATEVTRRQMVSAENDLAVAALFLATLVYGVRYARSGKLADVVLASLAFGLLVGVKYYALGYAGVAGLGVIVLAAARRGPRLATRAAAIGLAGALLLGGYWYVRNMCAAGSPLYPKGFTESTDVWGKMRPDTSTSTLAGSGRPEVWPMLGRAVAVKAGPCQFVAAVALPATLVWLAVSAVRRRGRGAFGRLEEAGVGARAEEEALSQWEKGRSCGQSEREASGERWLRGWLALLVLLSALVFVKTPNVVETVPGTMNMLRWQYHPVRFSLCSLSLAVVALAVVTDDVALFCLGRSRLPSGTYLSSGSARWVAVVRKFGLFHVGRYAIYGSWVVGVGYQVFSHSGQHTTLDHVLLATNVVIAGVLLRFLVTSSVRYERYLAYVVVLCALASAVWGCHWLAERWHRDYARHYDDSYFRVPVLSAIAPLDPKRECICVCDDRYYPFFGSRRQFDVCRPLWLPDSASLRDYLLSREVTLLVARNRDASPRRRYERVEQWITEHPDLFQPLHQDDRFTIVRVNRARLKALRSEGDGQGASLNPTPNDEIGEDVEQKAIEGAESGKSNRNSSMGLTSPFSLFPPVQIPIDIAVE